MLREKVLSCAWMASKQEVSAVVVKAFKSFQIFPVPDGKSGQSCGVLELEWPPIADTGHRGVPYPDIRCPDRHLADAEVVFGLIRCPDQLLADAEANGLGLKLPICQTGSP